MKRLSLFLFVVLLTACGGNQQPNDGSNGTQKTRTFKLTHPETGKFKVDRGATQPFTVRVDITQPDAVEEVKITLSPGPGVEITPRSEARIKDNTSYTFEVKVLENTTQLEPYINFVAEGVGESNNQDSVQETFRWPIQ
jgi:hypothetical protein